MQLYVQSFETRHADPFDALRDCFKCADTVQNAVRHFLDAVKQNPSWRDDHALLVSWAESTRGRNDMEVRSTEVTSKPRHVVDPATRTRPIGFSALSAKSIAGMSAANRAGLVTATRMVAAAKPKDAWHRLEMIFRYDWRRTYGRELHGHVKQGKFADLVLSQHPHLPPNAMLGADDPKTGVRASLTNRDAENLLKLFLENTRG